MKNWSKIYAFILFCFTFSQSIAQNDLDNIEWCVTIEPEAIKYLIANKPHATKKDNFYQIEIDSVVTPAGQIWVKRRDRNCFSANFNDCQIMCLTEVPEVTTKKMAMLPFNCKALIEIETGIVILRKDYDAAALEIPCKGQDLTELKALIIKELARRGWLRKKIPIEDFDEYKDYCEENFLEALTSFQSENNLSEGHLDKDTLIALGILEKRVYRYE